jgi:hypothetical protein
MLKNDISANTGNRPVRTRVSGVTKCPAHEPPAAVYALKAWTVRKSRGKWYIAPTVCFGKNPTWSKPYATLQRATTAIARKLAEEWLMRHKRRCAHYGITE